MAVELAEGGGVKPFKKRTSDRQMHRKNVPADSTTEYFKRAATIPFLDQLIGQIQTRFPEGNLDAFDVMHALPSHVTSKPEWAEHFSVSCKSTEMACKSPTSSKLIKNVETVLHEQQESTTKFKISLSHFKYSELFQ